MSTKRFIIKVSIRLIILIVALVIISSLTGTFDTIINNELALGQMENSTEAFLFMKTYTEVIKPIATLFIALITSIIVIGAISDTYKFIKTKEKNKNEKEL